MSHHPQKCAMCALCVREGGESRRVGAVVLVVWTRVGPFTMTLCPRCAKPAVDALGIDADAIEEGEG